jgi:hypothetical protein
MTTKTVTINKQRCNIIRHNATELQKIKQAPSLDQHGRALDQVSLPASGVVYKEQIKITKTKDQEQEIFSEVKTCR